MANFPISENPSYSQTMRMLEPTDKATAELFNTLIKVLLDNDLFVYQKMEEKADKSEIPSTLPANGGNADTVDNFHAWQLQNLNASGSTESTYVKSQFVNTTKGFYLSADNGTGASMVRTVSVRMADTLYGVSSSAPSSPQTNDLWIW